MKQSSYRPNLALYLAGFVFQTGAVVYFFTHFDAAILRLMPDDAFYYLKIAENISNGLGSVFSEGEPTNGYHPLWMLLLSLTHRVVQPSPEGFILWVLMLAVLLNLVAAHLLYVLLRREGFSHLQSLCGAACLLFMPWTVNLTLTGLETPLYFVCLIGFLIVAQSLLHKEQGLTASDGLWLGITAALAMLARTDSIFFTVPAFALILWKLRRRSLKALLIAGSVATLLMAPWLIWSFANFGTIGQSSSVAISALQHYNHPWLLSWDYLNFARYNFAYSTYWVTVAPLVTHLEYGLKNPRWEGLAVGVLLLAAAVALYRHFSRRDFRLPVILYAPVAALVIFYSAVRLFVQPWHLAAALILAIVYVLNFLPEHRLNISHLVMVVAVLMPLTAFSLRNGYFRPQETEGRIAYFRHDWPDSQPGPHVVCITDAGMPAYFSPHTVVNVDGVVNNRALAYILAGRFSDYISLKQCDFVILDESRLDYYDRNMAHSADGSAIDWQ